MEAIKVLVVDDSALVRQVLSEGLSRDPDIEVVGRAADPYRAAELINKFSPDVLTLDVEMPRMDGLEFLRRLMARRPLPVVMVSSLTERGSRITLEALANGAVDFVLKPRLNIRDGLNSMMTELRQKVKMAARVPVTALNHKGNGPHISPVRFNKSIQTTDKVIAIGASTGGTEAIRKVVCALPPNSPGIVVVQHMPAGFTHMFAERLNELSELTVKEAKSGDRVMTGTVLVAPGNYHMQLIRSGGEYRVVCRMGARVNGHRPSVDVLFRSVARHAGANAIGVMLTGMGDDGADAMVKMRQSGARTVAQDEATSVVFGMPKEAYARGGAEMLAPIEKIPEIVKQFIDGMH